MKTLVMILLLNLPNMLYSQTINVESTNGYTVTISLSPYSIVPDVLCFLTGHYVVLIPYTITFSGTNIPPSLTILQGTMDCTNASGIFFSPSSVEGTGIAASATATALVSQCGSITCTSMHLTIEGPGISNRTINLSGSQLSMELTSFNVTSIETKNKINWTSVSTSGSKGYELEKSADLIHWQLVKKFASSGQVDQLEFIDPSPIFPITYYRIKLIDFNDTFFYSPVKSIRTNARRLLTYFPNPVKNKLILDATTLHSTYHIADQMGRIIESNTTSDRQTSIKVDHLNSGMYVIIYEGNTGIFVKN